VRKGSNVEMVHTHPTKVFDSQSSSEAADASVLRRVPPSPVDLINMFGVENGLTNTEKERMSFSTVSEDGRWIYEAKPDAQMESAIAASEPFIRQLSGPYARHAPAAARALRNFVYQSSNNDRASMQGVEPVIRSMQTGSYPDYLRSTPTSLFQHAQLFKGLSANSNMPDGAKLYFGAIVNAYDAMDTTLREKDPDGHGFLETFSTIPMMEDGQGDFAPYREFWDKRGVNLRYEPFGV
ncbi:hypothetical protein KKG57_01220, partial [Patescibacteria group bacterium]|nr:hypothetical protein [Patescibacteria group bacterium]